MKTMHVADMPARQSAQNPDRESTLAAAGDFILITCEHGGNRIPPPYRYLFNGHEALLRTHRGYDTGALRFARELAATLPAPLVACTVSRLLVDLNRSRGHPRLYSEASRGVAPGLRQEILSRYYLPYRDEVEARIASAVRRGARVIHISCHSFTPELDGKPRNTDLGLLYDPARAAEADLCRELRGALRAQAPTLKVRLNYPYRGTADGFTVYLRRRFPPERYLGIELEINQAHVRQGGSHWRTTRAAIVAALHAALPASIEPV